MLKKLWAKAARLRQNYPELPHYILAGCGTAVVNYSTYALCFYLLQMSNVISDSIAWFVSVCFAFITNKLYVFHSHSKQKKQLLFELASFFGCRILTGGIDVFLMYWTVDKLLWPAASSKVGVSILVSLLNYLGTKLFVFPSRMKNRFFAKKKALQNQPPLVQEPYLYEEPHLYSESRLDNSR